MIFDWWDLVSLGLDLTELLIFILLVIVISLVLYTIFLKIALGLTKAKHTDFGEVFVTALICALVGWIPCIGCILSWVVINSRHDTGFLMAIVVWLLAIIIGLIITVFIVIAILGLFGLALTLPWP